MLTFFAWLPLLERPCDGGGACEWVSELVSETWSKQDGHEQTWNDYCERCLRWRDWTRSERSTPSQPFALLSVTVYDRALSDEEIEVKTKAMMRRFADDDPR